MLLVKKMVLLSVALWFAVGAYVPFGCFVTNAPTAERFGCFFGPEQAPQAAEDYMSCLSKKTAPEAGARFSCLEQPLQAPSAGQRFSCLSVENDIGPSCFFGPRQAPVESKGFGCYYDRAPQAKGFSCLDQSNAPEASKGFSCLSEQNAPQALPSLSCFHTPGNAPQAVSNGFGCLSEGNAPEARRGFSCIDERVLEAQPSPGCFFGDR